MPPHSFLEGLFMPFGNIGHFRFAPAALGQIETNVFLPLLTSAIGLPARNIQSNRRTFDDVLGSRQEFGQLSALEKQFLEHVFPLCLYFTLIAFNT